MISRLKEIFLELNTGTKRSVNIEKCQDSYAFKNTKEYGVYLKYDGEVFIDEKFNSIKLYSASVEERNVLILSCNNFNLMSTFLNIVYDFINIDNRSGILRNPYIWFENWKEIIGNYKKDLMVYDIIGELKCFILLHSKYGKVAWSAIHMGTHDLESNGMAFEVKTTVNKTINQITISSSQQLSCDNSNELYLLFVKVEKSENGYSIDDLMNEIKSLGVDTLQMEEYLNERGYSEGKKERYCKYIVRNIFKYFIDDTFPKITEKQFKYEKIPDGIVSINYVVDLSNINYEDIL